MSTGQFNENIGIKAIRGMSGNKVQGMQAENDQVRDPVPTMTAADYHTVVDGLGFQKLGEFPVGRLGTGCTADTESLYVYARQSLILSFATSASQHVESAKIISYGSSANTDVKCLFSWMGDKEDGSMLGIDGRTDDLSAVSHVGSLQTGIKVNPDTSVLLPYYCAKDYSLWRKQNNTDTCGQSIDDIARARLATMPDWVQNRARISGKDSKTAPSTLQPAT